MTVAPFPQSAIGLALPSGISAIPLPTDVTDSCRQLRQPAYKRKLDAHQQGEAAEASDLAMQTDPDVTS